MNKFFATTAAAILALAVTSVPARAHHELGHFIAGAIAGAIIGGALAQHQRGGAYYGAPVYGAPAYTPAPVYIVPPQQCYTRRGVVLDPWGHPRRALITSCNY